MTLLIGKFTSKNTELKESNKLITWDKGLNWSKILPELYKKVKPNKAICLFAQAPFTYQLYNEMTNAGFKWKYNWVWKKTSAANFASAKHGPLKIYEEVLVFYKPGKEGKMPYNHGAKINEKNSKKYKCTFYNKHTKEVLSDEYVFDNFILNTRENNRRSFYQY